MNEMTLQAEAGLILPEVLHNWCGAWAIDLSVGQQLFDRISTTDLTAHFARVSAVPPNQAVTVTNHDGIAIIDVVGTLQKARSSMGGTSTTMLRQAVRSAAKDADIKGIMLRIDSPGGTVAGNDEAAQEIAKAAGLKPVWSYVEDLGASAAYWLASQSSKIIVNRTGRVGSIGTYMAVADYSAAAEKEGVKVYVVRAGEFKGSGEPGTEITAKQLAEWQRQVDELNSFFLQAVASGRGRDMATVQSWADGRVHIGQSAVDLGLADGVASFEDALSAMSRAINPRGKKMSEPTNATKAATIAELKAAFPDMSADWREGQLEAGHTMEQANAAYTKALREQNAALKAKADEADKKAAEAKEQAEKATAERDAAKNTHKGNQGIGSGEAPKQVESGNGVDRFEAAVSDRMEKNGGKRAEAVAFVSKNNPTLREEYVRDYNAANRAKVPATQTPRV